jgi:tagatose 1,6-diphosphate aldolase
MSNGKFEGLRHISNSQQQFTIVATDQRGSLKRMINPSDPSTVSVDEIMHVKKTLITHLAGKQSHAKSSGVLVDPEYSYQRSFLQSCNIRSDVGVLMSVEASGYGPGGECAPQIRIFEELNVDAAVAKIKYRGAAAVKLLVYYHPESPTRRHQESKVKSIGLACEKHDIAFLLEPVSHSIEEGPQKKQHLKEFSQQKPWIVIETAKELTKPEYCVDVLKAEFPLNLKFAEELHQDPAEVCHELDEASQIPWVILSAGVDYEEFLKNLRYAVDAGASGFLCGRAIWKEAVGKKDMDAFLRATSVTRLNQLVEIVEQHARPWFTKYVDALQDIDILRGD